jgi:hypothetical protein
MLPFEISRWSNPSHAFGSTVDIPARLRQLGRLPAGDRWFMLCSSLCHQGSICVAAFGVTDTPLPADSGEPYSPMLLWAVFVLVITMACIVVVAIIAVLVAVLLALGVVSSSAFIGLSRGRLSSGLRAFHYQFFVTLAIPGGIGALWCWTYFFGSPLGWREMVMAGSTAGLCSGLLVAFVLDRLAGIVHRRYFVSSTLP